MSSYIDHINEHKKVFNSLNLFEKEILAISKILKKQLRITLYFFVAMAAPHLTQIICALNS